MKRKLLAFAALLILAVQPTALAQEPEWEAEVYKLTWIDALQMEQILNAVLTKTRVRSNRALNVVAFIGSDRDKILVEELIKRYDVPPADLEFQFYVLRGTTEGEGVRDGVPDSLKAVLKEVGSLTRFTGFELIDSPILRAREGHRAAISGQGPLGYEIQLDPKQVIREGNTASIRIDDCVIQYRVLAGYTVGDAVVEPERLEADKKEAEKKKDGVSYAVKPLYRTGGMQTSLIIGDGETVVLGASRMPAEESGDWAVITVITARILR